MIQAPTSHHLRHVPAHMAMDASTPPHEDEISPHIKAEFEEWGTKTTGGVLAGMLYGGAREAASAAKMEHSRLPFPHEDKMKPKGKIIREMTENKVLRIARGLCLEAPSLEPLWLCLAAFSMDLQCIGAPMTPLTQSLLVPLLEARSVSHGSLGFCTRTVPGSLVTRVSSAAIGTILGGSVALPLGWLQSTLQAELNPVQDQEALQLAEPKVKYEEGQRIDAIIRRLESRAPESSLRSQE